MILFGASGHAKVVLDILFLNGKQVELILDDNPTTSYIFNIPVKQSDVDYHEDASVIVSIGNNFFRKKVVDSHHFIYEKAIHPSAIISEFSSIGIGTVVMAGVIINASAKVGNHCILNTCSTIDHDCFLEDFVHISPNASLAGNVHIGEGTQIGIGAVVIQGIRIGKWCIIGAGAVIIKDVPDYAVVVGNPGRIIRYNNVDKL